MVCKSKSSKQLNEHGICFYLVIWQKNHHNKIKYKHSAALLITSFNQTVWEWISKLQFKTLDNMKI